MPEFRPQVVAFCCTHCAYNAADLAGSLRMQYPPAIKIVQVPCSGRVDTLHLLHAFEDGADGVLVAGCLLGDCHYLEGNYSALRRVRHAQQLIEAIGLQAERLQMVNLSSAMGNKFAEAAVAINEVMDRLGPSPLRALPAGEGDSSPGPRGVDNNV